MVLKSDPTHINPKVQPEMEHISEDEIDSYVLQTFIDGTSDSSIEQHLDCCHMCQVRLEEACDFIQALRETIHNTAFSQYSLNNGISVN